MGMGTKVRCGGILEAILGTPNVPTCSHFEALGEGQGGDKENTP